MSNHKNKVTTTCSSELVEFAKANGVNMSGLLENALTKIIESGEQPVQKKTKKVTLTISKELVDYAKANKISLADILTTELKSLKGGE